MGHVARREQADIADVTYDSLMTDAAPQIGDLAGDAMDLFIETVAQVPPDGWEQPSNLDDWSVRELVGHTTGSAAKMVAFAEDAEVWGRSEPSDWMCDDPVARLRDLAAQLRTALPGADLDAMRTSAEGEAPLRRALTFPVADLAMHSWDVHRSLGRLIELPAGLLAFCRDLVDSVPEDMLRRPGGFGPAQPVPADATPTSRLMAFLGRSVGDVSA